MATTYYQFQYQPLAYLGLILGLFGAIVFILFGGLGITALPTSLIVSVAKFFGQKKLSREE
jgi:cell division protein FtsX